jgi:hypothetical protein
MPTSNPAPTVSPEQRLIGLFSRLDAADRHTLLAFAEFLAAGGTQSLATPTLLETPPDSSPFQPQKPHPLPRPGQEKVIAAIRRLTLTYPMLDHSPMLHETTAMMSAHVLQGRPAAQVIDDLEALFQQRYQDYCATFDSHH